MLVSVTLLRRVGVRLRAAELAPAAVGDLRIGDAGSTTFRRPVLVAHLWEQRCALDRPIGLPLFEPALVHVGADGFSLAGVELHTGEGRMRECVQVWQCVPAR